MIPKVDGDDADDEEAVTATIVPYYWADYDISATEDSADVTIRDGFGKVTIRRFGGDEIEEASSGYIQFYIQFWGHTISGATVHAALDVESGTAIRGTYSSPRPFQSGYDGVDYYLEDESIFTKLNPNAIELDIQSSYPTAHSTSIYLYPIDDPFVEPDETAIIALKDTSTTTVNSTSGSATAIIKNDDDYETVTITVTDATAKELNAPAPMVGGWSVDPDTQNLARVKITRQNATSDPLDVFYEQTGSADTGTDYVLIKEVGGPFGGD